jgi:hypothetical protein
MFNQPLETLKTRLSLPTVGLEDTARSDDVDNHLTSSSVLIAVGFGALAMIYSLVLFHYQLGWEHGLRRDAWYQPGDVWNMVNGGRYVWDGALGYVYRGADGSYALPISYILAAPVAAIIDHFHLVEGMFALPRPTAWPLAGSFVLAFNIFFLDSLRRLAWQIGMRRRLWAVQVVGVLLVCVPAFQYGHFEDVLALTFLLYAVRYVLLDRILLCCFLLSLAISCKQWAVLAVPLVILLSPKGRRLIALVVCSALPLFFVGLVALADPKFGLTALFSPVSPKKTDIGYASVLLTWFGSKASQATRTASVLVSPLVALVFRSVRTVPSILGALSVLLLLRPLFEPLLYSYYLMPALLVAGLVGAAAHKRFRIRDWIFQVAALFWAMPHSNLRTNGRWWIVELCLLVLTWVRVAMNCGLARPWVRRLSAGERVNRWSNDCDASPDKAAVANAALLTESSSG